MEYVNDPGVRSVNFTLTYLPINSRKYIQYSVTTLQLINTRAYDK